MSSLQERSEKSFTEQQRRALETRGVSVILSSGAGCGKTHVLTERYLGHLREGCQVDQLVALTFTDRAARQMRARIRAAVIRELLAAGQEQQAESWARHLRMLENASICTIHAFCGTLLRQFGLEIGIDPQFEVLEEILASNLRTEALTATLQRLLLVHGPWGEDLRELVLLHGWSNVVSTLNSLLREGEARAWRNWIEQPPEHLARQWKRYAQDELLPRYLNGWVQSESAIRETLTLLQSHPPQPGPMSEAVAFLLRETPLLPRAQNPAEVIERLVAAAKVGRIGAKAWPEPGVYAAIKTAFERYREALRGLNLEVFQAEESELIASIEVGQRWLRVAGEGKAAYQEKKRYHGVVDFQDLLSLGCELLCACPEVRSRLQERIRHVLIDELQDTDPLQVELVEYLTGAGLGAGKLFAVGDYKQSIYRFRGAEVSLFEELRQRVPLQGRQSLSVNFRSQPAILNFVNALFEEVLPHYEPLVSHQAQRNPGPCIEFLWSTAPAQASVRETRMLEAERIAQRLARMIGHDCLLPAENGQGLRPVRAGDIVLLFRAMSNVHLYESALRRHGLDYYLVGGRAFFAQQEIYDLVHLLRALENPQDELSLAATLRSPFCCLSDEALFVLCRHRRGLWAALADEHTRTLLPEEQRPRAVQAYELLCRWRAQKDRSSIASLLHRIFADSAYDAAVTLEYLGERKLANLWKLQELARSFDRTGLFGLAEFITRLSDLVATQPQEEQAATQPEKADVVRLMTIHQAKGLEFPVVVIPDMASVRGSPHGASARWDRKLGCVARPPVEEDTPLFSEFAWRLFRAQEHCADHEEELRTLYVACTRPRDYLILSAAWKQNASPEGTWMQTLASRFDLQTGRERTSRERDAISIYINDRHYPSNAEPVSVALSRPRHKPVPPPELPCFPRRTSVSTEELDRYLREPSLFPEEISARSSVELELRTVLERWDFSRSEGWRDLLPTPQQEVAEILRRCGRSPFRARLGQAIRLCRGMPYLLQLDPAAELPVVTGCIDGLWQDQLGVWHLVEWVTESVPHSRQQKVAQQRHHRLSLAAEAFKRQLRQELGSIVLWFVRSGQIDERPPAREIPADLLEVLRRISSARGVTPLPRLNEIFGERGH